MRFFFAGLRFVRVPRLFTAEEERDKAEAEKQEEALRAWERIWRIR